MWGNNKKHTQGKVDTLIGRQTEMRGNIVFSGGLHVDGSIKGNVIADGESSSVLVLSEGGAINGEVRVPYIIINGSVEGDLHALECIELAAQARITGNVYYNKIVIAIGAEINGQLVHIDEAVRPVVALGHDQQFLAEEDDS